MNKVLIITYYWPPMGGGGVQRWLKMSKYFKEFGWNPVIYTPENADIANYDESLEKDVSADLTVVRRPIWEPFDLYKRFVGKSKDEKIQPGFLQESESNRILQALSVWIRGNLFVPDAKKYWIKPSVKYLKEYLKENGIEYVITTGPPHSNHLIGLHLKKKIGIKWLADFRDPWTYIDYYDKLKLTAWADRLHHKMEKEVLKNADRVVTVSWSWAKDFERDAGRLPDVVTNGYDPTDFENHTKYVPQEKLNITHIGSLNADRNPHALWKALNLIKEEGILDLQKMQFKFIGPTDHSVFNAFETSGLSHLYEHIPNVPHKSVIQEIQRADVLLLPLNDTANIDGVIPGKLYEYLASKRPILCIGKPSGDSAKIILESEAGSVFDFGDVRGIKNAIEEFYNSFFNGGILSNEQPPAEFSRRTLAGNICAILDEIN